MPNSYAIPETPELRRLFQKADDLKAQIDLLHPLANGVWETIQEKLRIDWTYNSNAIEGNSLTRGETLFFLREGLTVEGKPLKDFLEARNHHEAIKFLHEVIQSERPISEGLIKEINALLLSGVDHTPAVNQFNQPVQKPATSGQYKKLPNHVQLADGTLHKYVDPIHVPAEMGKLIQWTNQNLETAHPVITSAFAHYNFVRIHPFDDGNGRGARILMNLILIKKGFPPAVIKNEDRRVYLNMLAQADKGNLEPFVTFVGKSLVATQEVMVKDLKENLDRG